MKGTISFEAPHSAYIPGSDETGAGMIASWLGNDIQYSIAAVDRRLTRLASVERGERTNGYFGAGNVAETSTNRELVYIQEIAIPELKVLMTHAQARDALLKYRAFLENGWRASAPQPEPFEVEYIAEGAEAERLARQAGLDFVEVK